MKCSARKTMAHQSTPLFPLMLHTTGEVRSKVPTRALYVQTQPGKELDGHARMHADASGQEARVLSSSTRSCALNTKNKKVKSKKGGNRNGLNVRISCAHLCQITTYSPHCVKTNALRTPCIEMTSRVSATLAIHKGRLATHVCFR